MRVAFTDRGGYAESVTSGETATVATVPNHRATGAPTVTGTAQVDETLTADVSGITDANGLTNATFSYQWISSDGISDTDIARATDSTYTLVEDDEGNYIKVQVKFTDDAGHPETLTSASVTVPASDATLRAFELRDANGVSVALTPVYDPAVNVYTATVANSVDSVTLRATKNHAGASVAVLTEAGTSTPDQATADLAVGDNLIKAMVTAEDGNSALIYMVTVTRQEPSTASDDATLSAFELRDANGVSVALTPAYDPAVNVYTATVANSVDSVTLRATKNHAGASVAVLTEAGTSTPDQATADLAVGDNLIKAMVTAEDGNSALIYMVTVTREDSDDASLSAGESSSGDNLHAQGIAEKPTNLTGAATANGILLHWEAPAARTDEVTSYQILRRRPDLGEGNLIVLHYTSTAATSYLDESANEPGVRYFYRVKAIRNNDRSLIGRSLSDWSNEAEVTYVPPDSELTESELLARRALEAPTNLTAEATTQGVQLNWDAPSARGDEVTGYQIMRRLADSSLRPFKQVAQTTTSATSYFNRIANRGGFGYIYHVRALRGENETSNQSNEAHLFYGNPATPTNLTAELGINGIQLRWDSPTAPPNGYEILRRPYRGVNKFSVFTRFFIIPTVSYFDETATETGVLYSYKIRALRSAVIDDQTMYNKSEASSEVQVTYQDPPPPTNLTAEAVASGIQLNWRTPDALADEITGYQILRRRPEEGENRLVILVQDTGSKSTSYLDESANDPGVAYLYRIKAIRDGRYISKSSNKAQLTYTQPDPIVEEQQEEKSGPPTAPTLFRATSEDDGVSLEWLAPEADAESVTSYRITRTGPITDDDPAVTQIDTGSVALNYLDTGVLSGGAYFYQVSALRDEDLSEPLDGLFLLYLDPSSMLMRYVPLDKSRVISARNTPSNDSADHLIPGSDSLRAISARSSLKNSAHLIPGFVDQTSYSDSSFNAHLWIPGHGAPTPLLEGANRVEAKEIAFDDLHLADFVVDEFGETEWVETFGSGTVHYVNDFPIAQKFRTKSAVELTGFEVHVRDVDAGEGLKVFIAAGNDPNVGQEISLDLHEEPGVVVPTTGLVELTLSGTLANGKTTWSAPDGTMLSANTDYFIYFEATRESATHTGPRAEIYIDLFPRNQEGRVDDENNFWYIDDHVLEVTMNGLLQGLREIEDDVFVPAPYGYPIPEWTPRAGRLAAFPKGTVGNGNRKSVDQSGATEKGDVQRAPHNLRATASGDGSVSLKWDAPEDDSVTSYQILRSRPSEEEDNLTILVADTGSLDRTFRDVRVLPGLAYRYGVKAISKKGLSDLSNQAEATPKELPVNTKATGAPEIEGTAQVGEELTADTSGIEDQDGLDNVVYRYQWLADDANILGATERTYTLGDADEGKVIRVRVTFTDDADHDESLTSEGTEAVSFAVQEQVENGVATGTPTISGTAQVGEELTADTSGIEDQDGLDDVVYRYQWLADDANILGATERTYTLGDADEGKVIRVWVTFTDDLGNEESLTSLATAAVVPAEPADPPAAPTGLGATPSHDRVVLRWDDPQDGTITGYVILRRNRATTSGGEFTVLVADTGSAATSYTDHGVESGASYTYRVRAINGHGESELSLWARADTPAHPAAPAAPTGLGATPSHDRVVLRWDDPQDDTITGYVILRRNRATTQAGQFTVLVADTGSATTTYTDHGVESEESYTYRVRAINRHGESEMSLWARADTPPAP